MAVLDTIEVTVQVEDQNVTEYNDQDDQNYPTLSVTKYIEATSGATFKIIVFVPKMFTFATDALSFELIIDGIERDSSICKKSDIKAAGSFKQSFEGLDVKKRGKWQVRAFSFNEIKQVESKNPSIGRSEIDRIKNFGLIVIKVFKVRVRGADFRYRKVNSDLGHITEIPERELKGKNVTHNVTLGKKIKVPESGCIRIKYLGDDPVATFTFKYCSKKALQSLMLIPRTPSPVRTLPAPAIAPATPRVAELAVPLEERPVEELTMKEMQELVKRHQALYRQQRGLDIKFENGLKLERGVKRERDEEVEKLLASASAKKVKGPMAHGEVVDLSD